MYKFELSENRRTSVNYRQLSTPYNKSRIYSLLFVCSLILCFVVYFLVTYLTGSKLSSDLKSENSSRETIQENPPPSTSSYDVSENGQVSHLKTTKPPKISSRRLKVKLVGKTNLEQTSFQTAITPNSTPSHPSEAVGSSTLRPLEVTPETSAPEKHLDSFGDPTHFFGDPFLDEPTHSSKGSNLEDVISNATSVDSKEGLVYVNESETEFTAKCGMRKVKAPSSLPQRSPNTYFAEFPWMLVLLSGNHSSGVEVFKCGASLIAADVAVTAAHCVQNQYGIQYLVRAGDWYLDGTLKREYLPPEERPVVSIEIHPAFSSKTLENNIALLKLSKGFVYDDHIQPICLPDWNIAYDSGNCTVVGWGKDSDEDRSHHKFLRQVGLKLVSNDECEKTLQSSILGKYYELSPGALCASNASSTVASCKGDGGGPLLCPSSSVPDIYYQVGVSTWNVQCDPSSPGLYANVEFYRDWIDHILAKFQKAPL